MFVVGIIRTYYLYFKQICSNIRDLFLVVLAATASSAQIPFSKRRIIKTRHSVWRVVKAAAVQNLFR